MKCTRCATEILGVSYVVSRVCDQQPTWTGNFCASCMIAMCGRPSVNRIASALDRAGWVQAHTLPLIDAS